MSLHSGSLVAIAIVYIGACIEEHTDDRNEVVLGCQTKRTLAGVINAVRISTTLKQPVQDVRMTFIYGVKKRIIPGMSSKVDIYPYPLLQEDVDNSDMTTTFTHFLKTATGASEGSWRTLERLDDLRDLWIVVAVAGDNQRTRSRSSAYG